MNQDPLRDRLLGGVPKPSDVAAYRQNVDEMLTKNRKSLRREQIAVKAFWLFCAISATAWLWFSAESAHLPRGPFLACVFLILGGVEVVKHPINRSRLEVLTELKQLQLHVFELDQALASPHTE